MKTKITLNSFVERNHKVFLIKLWKELSHDTFCGGMPLGNAYIDARVKGDLIDTFYVLLDEAIAEKYPELAGKYKREL